MQTHSCRLTTTMADVTKRKTNRSAKETLQERRAEVEAAIRKKRECERKALAIVEHMVESETVDTQWLADNAEFINPSYYQDAVEERAIGKQCGFSLCSNRLEKVWKQQYCIHLSSKKVFDVTHRKNFCSDICFTASNKFKEQLLSSPLWMRSKDNIPQFEICHKPDKILRGDEVAISVIASPDEGDSDEEEVEITVKPKITSKKESSKPVPNPSEVVFERFRRWFTLRSVNWLRSIERELQEDIRSVEEKLLKMNVNTAGDDVKHKAASIREPTRYDRFKAFFSDHPEFVVENEDADDSVVTESASSVKENTEDATVSIVMPLANAPAQKIIRRKIVMDYVEKWFPRLTTMTGLEFRRCERDLSDLVSTFNLTSDTVTFRPNELPLLCLLLAFSLSLRDSTIKAKLTEEPIRVAISEFLVPYGQTHEQLQNFIYELCDSFEGQQ